ncbi:MAG TPA: VTT domain-containing protein [Acidimicrobiales bacterium]|nr:VTT domain-containing protein [Acidimicrobiales bacterium]
MRRLTLAWAVVAAVLLVSFGVAQALELDAFTQPGEQLSVPTGWAALAGVGLLVVDVVLPVPSSVVMVALGAVFGVAAGAVLSSLGGIGALYLAGWVGRHCRGQVRLLVGEDRERVEALVARYGAAAVILSRPVPVLAESVAVVAAAAGMPPLRFLAAGTAGVMPVSVAYAVSGGVGAQANGFVLAGVLIAVSLASLGVSSHPARGRPGLARRRS